MSLKVQPSSSTWLTETEQTQSAQFRTKRQDLESTDVTQQTDISVEELESAVDGIGSALEVIDRGLQFSVHEDTNRVMVSVVDRNTQEVIKEIPPEQVLDMLARIRDMIGLLIDERA